MDGTIVTNMDIFFVSPFESTNLIYRFDITQFDKSIHS